MDANELNAFIQTEAGKAWIEEQKAPLVAKRDELLGEVKAVNGRLAETAQRAEVTSRLLEEERASMAAIVVDARIAQLLEKKGVPEILRPAIIAELKTTYGPAVKANGLDRVGVATMKQDGKDQELTLEAMVDHWSQTEGALGLLTAVGRAGSTGGGARGGAGPTGSARTMPIEEFERMSAAEKMAFVKSGGRPI